MATTHFSTLRDLKFADEAGDIRGALLYGTGDEKLGTIKDAIVDHRDGRIHWVVVDTGGWLRSHKFVLPADRIRPYPKHDDHFYADLTKSQVESFPPYDEKAVESEEKWRDYEDKYRRAWESAGNVGHQVGSDHNITPPADEITAAGGPPTGRPISSEIPGYVPDLTPQRLRSIHEPPSGPAVNLHPQEQTATSAAVEPISSQSNSPMKVSTLIGEKGPEGINVRREAAIQDAEANRSKRWQSFQSNVRESLPRIQTGCSICGVKPQADRTALGDERKKAS
jgi:hypothetical protein